MYICMYVWYIYIYMFVIIYTHMILLMRPTSTVCLSTSLLLVFPDLFPHILPLLWTELWGHGPHHSSTGERAREGQNLRIRLLCVYVCMYMYMYKYMYMYVCMYMYMYVYMYMYMYRYRLGYTYFFQKMWNFIILHFISSVSLSLSFSLIKVTKIKFINSIQLGKYEINAW